MPPKPFEPSEETHIHPFPGVTVYFRDETPPVVQTPLRAAGFRDPLAAQIESILARVEEDI